MIKTPSPETFRAIRARDEKPRHFLEVFSHDVMADPVYLPSGPSPVYFQRAKNGDLVPADEAAQRRLAKEYGKPIPWEPSASPSSTRLSDALSASQKPRRPGRALWPE